MKLYSKDVWPHAAIGDINNPAVIFLHGFMGSSQDFINIAENLKNKYYCVIPDLPGHGKNLDLPYSSKINYQTISTGLLDLINYHNLEKVSLIGYSLGGRVAMYFALNQPYQVRKLVIESANPGIRELEERRRRLQEDIRRANRIESIGMQKFVKEWYEMTLFDSIKRDDDRMVEMIQKRGKNDPKWISKIIQELSPGSQNSLWNEIPKLKMPMVVIAGELDTKYTEISRRIGRIVLGSKVKIVLGAGHNVHYERPDEYIALLNEILVEL